MAKKFYDDDDDFPTFEPPHRETQPIPDSKTLIELNASFIEELGFPVGVSFTCPCCPNILEVRWTPTICHPSTHTRRVDGPPSKIMSITLFPSVQCPKCESYAWVTRGYVTSKMGSKVVGCSDGCE